MKVFGVRQICSISLDVRCDSLLMPGAIEQRIYRCNGTRSLAKKRASHNSLSPIFPSLFPERPGIHFRWESMARLALVLQRTRQVAVAAVNVGGGVRRKVFASCGRPRYAP